MEAQTLLVVGACCMCDLLCSGVICCYDSVGCSVEPKTVDAGVAAGVRCDGCLKLAVME